jgi:hypothetical protein
MAGSITPAELGPNSINFFGSNLDSTVYVKGGVDGDVVFFGGAVALGKASFLMGDGTNQLTFAASQARAGFAYQGGAGNDTVILNTDSQYFGTASMKGGDGTNVLDARWLGNLSSFTYAGGKDSDVVLLGAAGGVIVNFKASLGEGADTANVNTSNFRSLKIDGGVGTDTLNHIAAAVTFGAQLTAFESITEL